MFAHTMRLTLHSLVVFFIVACCADAYSSQVTDTALVRIDRTARDSTFLSLPSVTVTAGLTQIQPARAPFSVEVLEEADIATLPVRSLSDALAYVQGVDLRRRGPLGVQSDVTIRGGTFEQSAVMINGMRLNDVQTGHNTFSIPVLPADIDRIEVVKGGAARALGAGAMDGAINIILKRPGPEPRLRVGLMGGDASYIEGQLSASVATGPIVHQLSTQVLKHAGWIPSSDVEQQSLLYTAATEFESGRVQMLLGITNKSFGANGFYTPRFPEQWEHLTTFLAGATLEMDLAPNVIVLLRGLSRLNEDEFRLKRYQPSFYTNTHRTEQMLLQTGVTLRSEHNTTSLLLEGGRDWIASSNLGTHSRLRGSVVIENASTWGPWRVTLGGGLLAFTDRIPLPTGGIDISYQLSERSTAIDLVYASAQVNGRIPTYTDLYYRDPATTGNPDLRLETARTAEVGYRHTTPTSIFSAALYFRNGRDMIDYAIDSSGKANAANISTVNVAGIDISTLWRLDWLWLRHVRVGLLYQRLTSTSPLRTRYVADNLRLQGVVETRWQLPLHITGTYLARLIERVTDPQLRLVHDIRLQRPIGPLIITVEATNLTSESYVETGWVPVPPRWARVGADWSF